LKMLVFSDSHTDVDTMKNVVDVVHPDRIVHLGDHTVDAILLKRKFPDLPFEMVRGNCDLNSNLPSEKIIQIDSLVVFMSHGDAYQVESGIEHIAKAGKEAGAQIILHGHTHKPDLTNIQGMSIMNPGRIGRISSKTIKASYGVIETSGNGFQCGIFFYDSLENNDAPISL
jgi:uncharacterized protein